MRKIIDFNKNWVFTDPKERCVLDLPHTWNAVDGQDGGNDYFRGPCTYAKSFSRPEGECVFLEINGAAMSCEVSLNGVKIASHEGGYSAFRVDLTEHLQEENELVLTVDNSANNRVYPQKADFTFYGGLYRNVNLILVPAEHFELLKDGTPGIKVTPVVDLKDKKAIVKVDTCHNARFVEITVNGETKQVESSAEFTIEDVHLWDGLDDPYLYTATARLESGDEVSARFGCREFHVDPDKGFFLNGRSYPLRGVSRHQDRWAKGSALSLDDHKEDLGFIRELGANTLRLAHYQQAQEFYDLCDENGLIVWAEIPYITMHMPNGRQNTLDQMRELISQCYNHPSIICWGLSNEITAASQVDEDLLDNHRMLNDLCHRMDLTRFTTMASAFMLEIDNPILEIPDVNSYNLYFGWYLGELEQNENFFDEYHAKYPERTIGFSEYGADANPAFHSSDPGKGDYTEEYQCVYHEHILSMIDERPWLWATHVWNLFDFAADGRDEGGKNGQNQKGLVTIDRKMKKDAFYLYKAAWSREPFVHLCGKRYVDRTEETTEIKVYSNQAEVSLYVDGNPLETKQGERIFTFSVPISGEHSISVKAGVCQDSMTIRHAAEANPTYTFCKGGDVVNWFDKDEFDPNCFSIRDTMGELSKNPETAPIVKAMMDKIRASRGDVAQATAGNVGLEKMLARMSLESLLKYAGDAISAEMIQQLNATLQKVRK